jgi:hypothetical protein
MNTPDSAEKKKKVPPRNRRKIVLLLVVFCAGFACWLVAGFSIHLPSNHQFDELRSARATWESQGIDDYRMAIETGYGRLWITVRNGEVELAEQDTISDLISARNVKYEDASRKALVRDESPSTAFHFIPYYPYYLTIENMFDYVDLILNRETNPPLISTCWQRPEMYYTVEYDTQSGYVSEMWQSTCYKWDIGMGLSCPEIYDCSSLFNVVRFEPLPEAAP